MSQIKTLARWWKAMDAKSVLNAVRLLRAGRWGGEENLDAARPLRARGFPLTIWARPGSADLMVFIEIFVASEYEDARALIGDPIETVLDLGANIGCSIAWFAELFPDARFVGVEPSPGNLALANRNLAPLIRAGRVTLVHAFAGATERDAFLARTGKRGSNEITIGDAPGAGCDQTVPVFTMPSIIAEAKLQRIDLLKCDIEGGEVELFADCREWIGLARWLVVELHKDLDASWLLARLRDAGADFDLKLTQQKHAGAIVAWLRRRD